MLTSKLPFKGHDQDHTFELIKKCQFDLPKDISPEAKDLIEKILRKNPSSRIGSANINDLMNHPFFKGINWQTISDELPPKKIQLSKS